MPSFQYKTRGNSSPERKSRIYFTCHPDDFTLCFEKICEDIFATQDCAVFYTEDMYAPIETAYRESDLDGMHLFVIPVTFRLLSQPNRAMDFDFLYAKQKNIPVLPIMMETGLDILYAGKDKFGEMQYLSPVSQDASAIGYDEKLKKYLEAVLIDSATAEKIRRAFDAYIFLSYRKKDRHYANKLMKQIHSYPEFRDIAIWYDEFLTPGESFRENIEKMMEKSALFTLLVTPNLLEYTEGKPNFVMGREYPAAKNANAVIFPVEAIQTDKKLLKKEYPKIPKCVSLDKEKDFRKALLRFVSKIANPDNDNDPRHKYYIGLAYLNGIDVETDRAFGLQMLASAADAGLLEAMQALYRIYHEGLGMPPNHREAVRMSEKIFAFHLNYYGEEHPHTMEALNRLATDYEAAGEYEKALALHKRSYELNRIIYGEEHPNTLTVLNNLASTYDRKGDYRHALDLQEKVYAARLASLGEDHPNTFAALNNLAVIYNNIGDYRKAAETAEKSYLLHIRLFGELHIHTLTARLNLSSIYERLGDLAKAWETANEVYSLFVHSLGEKHPQTLLALNHISVLQIHLKKYEAAVCAAETSYRAHCEVLGKEHPNTLAAMNILASAYGELGARSEEMTWTKEVYSLRAKILGEDHPQTMASLNNLAIVYGKNGEFQKEAETEERILKKSREILGETHPNTLTTMNNLAITYFDMGKREKALETAELAYRLVSEAYGEGLPDALQMLGNIAAVYEKLGDSEKAGGCMEQAYQTAFRALGKKHPITLNALQTLSDFYAVRGDFDRACALLQAHADAE
ncbi:MAG: tetratricopeptide repeat protein [Clostridia bacterium]|nr:tetratricopeptide repeat protein [Clostridia bacterium]